MFNNKIGETVFPTQLLHWPVCGRRSVTTFESVGVFCFFLFVCFLLPPLPSQSESWGVLDNDKFDWNVLDWIYSFCNCLSGTWQVVFAIACHNVDLFTFNTVSFVPSSTLWCAHSLAVHQTLMRLVSVFLSFCVSLFLGELWQKQCPLTWSTI